MRASTTIALLLLAASAAGAQPHTIRRPEPQPAALVGEWRLNVGRTHYGEGAERRRDERFDCAMRGVRVDCTIRGTFASGRTSSGRFAAALDDLPATVSGIVGVDRVRLREPAPGVLDATFLRRDRPVFGYRAYRSDDGASLTIVSVDPVSREALGTVVVYDAAPRR